MSVANTNVCGNCRFWGTADENHQKFKFRSCQAVIHDENGLSKGDNDCRPESPYFYVDPNDSWDLEQLEKIKEIDRHSAVVLDSSGYFAALRTQEDFGCSLYQSKN